MSGLLTSGAVVSASVAHVVLQNGSGVIPADILHDGHRRQRIALRQLRLPVFRQRAFTEFRKFFDVAGAGTDDQAAHS